MPSTARTSIYSMRMKTPGTRIPRGTSPRTTEAQPCSRVPTQASGAGGKGLSASKMVHTRLLIRDMTGKEATYWQRAIDADQLA